MNMPETPPTYQTLAHFAPTDVFKVVNTSLADGITVISYPMYPPYTTPFDPHYVTAPQLDARPLMLM